MGQNLKDRSEVCPLPPGPLKDLNRNIMLTEGLVKPENDEEEAFVQQAQQPKEDPNAKLIEAAALQQTSEAKNLDSKSVSNIADAKKKEAETECAAALA